VFALFCCSLEEVVDVVRLSCFGASVRAQLRKLDATIPQLP